MARTVLMQPASACAAERNWSIYGQIKSSARNRMQHDVADKLVFCHESLHYANKLQSAAHRMEVADWVDMDDTDDTDAEDAHTDEKGVQHLLM